MHSQVGHVTLLPAESSTSAPKAADLNPKDWDGRALLCLVPSHLLEEQEAGRGGWVAQPLGGAQGSHSVPPPPSPARGVRGGSRGTAPQVPYSHRPGSASTPMPDMPGK